MQVKRKQKLKRLTVLEKYSEKVTAEKIINISNNLLRMRTSLILQRHRLNKKEDTIQKYFIEQEVDLCDDFISDLEMEFGMCKYLLKNTTKTQD